MKRSLMPWRKGLLLAATSAALVWIILPYYGAVLWAVVIALLFAPLNQRLRLRWPARRNTAASLTLAVATVCVVLPVTLMAVALAAEATALYQNLQSGALNPVGALRKLFNALPWMVKQQLGRFGLVNFEALQARFAVVLGQGGQTIATQALNLGQNTFSFLVDLGITLYLAFFLIRDGKVVARTLQRALPLPLAQRQAVMDRFAGVVRATVKGNLLVAALQGSLGGLAFWALEVHGALLWGTVMAMASLVPAVGAALVWLPAATYFLATGESAKGLALIAFGILVIGLVDNVMRPILVGKDTGLPEAVVLISTLGGLATFGLNGFVLGPAIAAMFVAVWHLHLAP